MIFTSIVCTAILGSRWFGPVTIDQKLPVTGNPFDSTKNDVRAIFTGSGKRYERLAYFGKGKWHATLAAPTGGVFQAHFFVNGKLVPGSPIRIALSPTANSEFVVGSGKRFRLSSGKPYIPFGHNLAWQYQGAPSYVEQLADMAKSGLNWTRIWANHWDGKNPYIGKDRNHRVPVGQMNEAAFERWDSIIRECEKNRIKFQFVLLHHGLFSTTTDPNWGEHPWNTANGGFLKDPTDFFVNPRARSLTKDWLRYAIARWGHSPAVMAWELFNEVQWVDAAKKHPERIGDIVAWHREMGQFVRSLDPYHHLVTSSSSEELNPRVFETMDYLQPHSYPPSIFSAILSAPIPHDKPSFFGEFGVHFELVTEQVAIRALRDGFWAGLLACQAGPAQYWYWDEAYKYHLYQEYARESGVLKRTGFAENPKTKPVSIAVSGGSPSDLYVMPGIGWGATTKYVFELPVDGSTGSLPELSSYIQNRQGHNRGLMRDPIRLRFHAIEGGEAHVLVGGVSKAGGALQLSLNGAQVLAKSWPGSSGDRQIDQELVVPFPKGENELSIDNPGTDWIKLKGVRIPRIGSGVLATGMSSDRYCLMRIQWLGGFGPGEKSISFSSVIDGNYRMRQFDINTGIEKDSEVALRSGRISGYVPYSTDEGVALFHQ